ncbi:MAG: bifunctional GTP diphosphokinase/guanosine-3',5'-bis pyrophosphate 3'-pyrophosphohydrolase [Pseudomonadota bacterium]
MENVAKTTSSSLLSPDSTRFLISNLCSILETYLEPVEVREVYCAYLYGAEAHEGQTRLTGEPYIYHPLAVAKTMAEMRMDAQSIIAAILHDVIEDTLTVKSQIEEEFGTDVAQLVDGVSKLTHLTFKTRAEAQAENFHKMMLAMVKDVRVIMIKLADRLHNMHTLGAMLPHKRWRIARETLEIYAPIAQRLGMNTIRVELEQLGFQYLYPMRYKVLEKAVNRSRGNRKELMRKVEATICNRLEEVDIEARIYGREKNLYSIYKKMRQKRLSFRDVYDVFAIRMVVEDVDTCYRTLGTIHNLYKPVPGKFKDYIAIPKVNGYQSLHTILFGPHGIPIEVQIRSDEMDRIAQVGIAAHWLYKTGDSINARAQARTREWLRNILELQKSAGNSLEFLEHVKVDLFPDEVYVFTPAGEIRALPRGATAVDYGYSVHTDIGNTCVAVKIDRRLAPLSTVLQSGQTVEVITAPQARPNPLWLNFVVTGKARSNIRHHLKNLKKGEALHLGRRLLNKALARYDLSIKKLNGKQIDDLLNDLHVETLQTLLEDIGLGNRMAQLIARRLDNPQIKSPKGGKKDAESKPLPIKGTEGMVLQYGKCCYPIPGDPIIGMMSAGRGLVIHRENCRNVTGDRRRPDKWVQIYWSDNIEGEYTAIIRALAPNQRGMLASLAAKISDQNSNIENVTLDERDGSTTNITFQLTVKNRKHLAHIMRLIRKTPQVYKVMRIRG